jgi:C4-dicarboxylate-specific signal transduction histidine kinase
MRTGRKGGVSVAVAVTAFAVALTLVQYLYLDLDLKRNAEKEALQEAEYISRELAGSVENYFNKALAVTRTYARNILVYRENRVSREIVYKILESTLKLNRNYLAVWTMWEPDAYDGSDHKFKNSYLHDVRGSFAMTYYFNKGEILREVNDTTDFNENFYLIPKELRRPVILEPYYYQYNPGEKTYYETSLACPILEGDKFLGIMAIDMDMSDLQSDFNSMSVPGEPSICLLSNSGNFITHSSKDNIGKNIGNLYKNDFSAIKDSLSVSTFYTTAGISETTGEKVIRYFFPVSMKEMEKPWFVMIELSEKKIFGKVAKVRRASRDYLISSIVILVYLGFNIVDRRLREKKMLASIFSLEATRNELNSYKENLERLVEERTTANQKLNEELMHSNEELSMLNDILTAQKTELVSTLSSLQDTQEKMVISEKMASLGVLASGVAHEINNPLHFIKGGVIGLENYIRENAENHSENLLPLISAINTGVDRSAEIVTSLSHYTRTDTAQNLLCDVNFIIDNCIVILQSQLRDRVSIERNYACTSCHISGNEGKLHQAFLNIISNANQAIEEEGYIKISTNCSGGMVNVFIEDSGKGMDEETLEKAFDPFFTTKEPGKGTGLGLSITSRIIQEHGGSISFESKPGKGTVAKVVLPEEKVT